MTWFLDLRAEQVDPFPAKGTPAKPQSRHGRDGKTQRRRAIDITGIVVHQTACVFGPSADREKAYRRALGIPAHAVAFRDGVVALPAPLDWYLYHGNELNGRTLGLEIEGIYPGRPNGPVWGKNPPTPLDALAVETACAALARLVEEGRALGMPLEWVYAHRQSNGQKPSDPGFEIWRDVVLGYAVPKLGLKTRVREIVGDGKPIPTVWDPDAFASY